MTEPSVIRPRSRIKGVASILVSLRRLRMRADRCAAYRTVTDPERRWLYKLSDAIDGLELAFQRLNDPTEPQG